MRGAAPVPAKRIMSRWAQSPLRHQRSLQCLKETRLQCFTAHGTTFSILPLKEKKEKLFVFLEGSSTFRLSAASARQKVLEKKKQFQKKKKKGKAVPSPPAAPLPLLGHSENKQGHVQK